MIMMFIKSPKNVMMIVLVLVRVRSGEDPGLRPGAVHQLRGRDPLPRGRWHRPGQRMKHHARPLYAVDSTWFASASLVESVTSTITISSSSSSSSRRSSIIIILVILINISIIFMAAMTLLPQVENFGIHINVDGSIMYGIYIEAIMHRKDDDISLVSQPRLTRPALT
jgi:hypothetical protein